LQKFSVDSINVSITTGKGNRNTGNAVVTVVKESGGPLDAVAIEGQFSGDSSGTRTGTTDGNGLAGFNTPKVKGLSYIQFCVDLASKTGWELDIESSTLCGDSNGGGSAFGAVAGSITDATSDDGISNAAVTTDTGQSDNSDAFGDYSIANVPVGNRNVAVTVNGYDSQNTAASVTENATTTVDFALNEQATGGAGAIKGTVYSGSAKLSGVKVQVLGGSSSITNKGGKYIIQNVPAGLHTVTASKTGYPSQQWFVTIISGSNVTQDFTLAPE
jgi:hypothetical protein